ncbi:response regulator [Spirochaeta cellobiosiphila]|uniref:response regulator n=1 Tax=Spirochaeta cellobiosiphila TaxID=504483 RepID=UPI0003FB3B94|nr:response regulator [Spirochaeta cellobiosiphila]
MKDTIFIIDDADTNIDLLELMLEQEDYNTLSAKSGKEALRRMDTNIPDLILLDIQMPFMDGFETCRLIKDNPKLTTVPIIFMSGLADTEDKVKGFRAGAVDYVTKPFETEELLARINTHLTLKKLQDKQVKLTANLESQIKKRTQKIEKALEERDIMLHEIHHRVKNNLQVILSLLNLQQQDIENEHCQKVLGESCGRIQSMALIHELIYESEDLGSVSLMSYLHNLFEYIISGRQGDSIGLKFEAIDANIGIEQLVPLGLLVNEIINILANHNVELEQYFLLDCLVYQIHDRIYLEISDQRVRQTEFDKSEESLKFMIIEALTLQLRGQIEYSLHPLLGFKLSFPLE